MNLSLPDIIEAGIRSLEESGYDIHDQSNRWLSCQLAGAVERYIKERVGTVGWDQLFPREEEPV